MGRQSIAEQRRIQIGRALQACMLEKGSYESTSVKDIAQRADMAARADPPLFQEQGRNPHAGGAHALRIHPQ